MGAEPTAKPERRAVAERDAAWVWLSTHGPASVAQLSAALGISPKRLTNRMRELCDKGAAEIAGRPEPGAGDGRWILWRAVGETPIGWVRQTRQRTGAGMLDAVDWLAEYGPARACEYAADMGITGPAAWGRIEQALGRGWVARVRRGVYRVTEAGKAQISR